MPYNNYPKAATENAQRALDHKEKNGSDCGTPVGWARARQLADRETISKETVRRTYSFLSRAKVYDQGDFTDEDGKEICGSIMYAAWGGDEMLRWSRMIIDRLEEDRDIDDLSDNTRTALENKVKEHNEEFGDIASKRVTLGMLTKVYERGIGAYNTNPESVRPSVSSPEQWAMARVNSFLYAVRNERFRGGKHDTDLFPDGHPLKSEEKMESKELRLSMVINEDIAIIDDRLAYSTQEKAEEMAKSMGLNGFHEHEYEGQTWYMPGEMHMVNYHDEEDMVSYHEEEEEDRAEPGELAVGDFVRWSTSGGNAYGRIIQVETAGDIEADSGFIIKGTAEDPAALIRLYRYDSDSDAYIERQPVLNVAHSFSRLEKFDAEVRNFKHIKEQREFRLESTEYDGQQIRGYAAVYNSDSEWMGGFYEQIERGAFDDVLNNDTRAYFNHDESLLLGRVSSGTLRISTDERGLYYEVDLPNTSYANDLVELMKRGDVNQSSFAFLIERDRWEERDGKTYRIIEKVSRLLDVSPVSQPAYPEATSQLVERNNTPEPEGVEAEAKAEAEENSGNELFEYKLKILNLDS